MEKSSNTVKKEGITPRDNGLCNVPDAFTIQVKFLLGAFKLATEIRNTFEKVVIYVLVNGHLSGKPLLRLASYPCQNDCENK